MRRRVTALSVSPCHSAHDVFPADLLVNAAAADALAEATLEATAAQRDVLGRGC